MNDLDGLDPLRVVPAPRRTDAAFAHAVAAGVRKQRWRQWLVVPSLAVAALALFVLRVPAELPAARVGADALALYDDDAGFAIPDLDGSSDEDLARLEHALDRRLAAKNLP